MTSSSFRSRHKSQRKVATGGTPSNHHRDAQTRIEARNLDNQYSNTTGKSRSYKESTSTDTAANNGSYMPKTFPEVLKEILSDASNADAITWLPHGKSFLVMNRKRFVEQVLPKYLGKATKYTSFTRKLSRWNFSRVPSGPDEGAWFNKNFYRDDDVQKVREMKCSKRKKLSGGVNTPQSPCPTRITSPTPDTVMVTPISTRDTKPDSDFGEDISALMPTAPRINISTTPKRSIPLKKRPVDASLFNRIEIDSPLPTKKIATLPRFSPTLSKQHHYNNHDSLPVYPFHGTNSGRPLALRDTQSVISAAMSALMQSSASGRGPPPFFPMGDSSGGVECMDGSLPGSRRRGDGHHKLMHRHHHHSNPTFHQHHLHRLSPNNFNHPHHHHDGHYHNPHHHRSRSADATRNNMAVLSALETAQSQYLLPQK